MKHLLENDFPAYYGVGRRRNVVEEKINDAYFDLLDVETNYLALHRQGEASFANRGMDLSVVKYDRYLDLFDGTCMSDGKRRCDFIITDFGNNELIALSELTSAIGEIEQLNKPIDRFPGGKFEKVEKQLSDTLANIMPVPSIQAYIKAKSRKICVTSYIIHPRLDETESVRKAFNRNLTTEAAEAGDGGAQIACPVIEQYGFMYYRISHDYTFVL